MNGRKETDTTLLSVLMDYWMTGAELKEKKARKYINDGLAWSAAFISFVVKDALAKSGSPHSRSAVLIRSTPERRFEMHCYR